MDKHAEMAILLDLYGGLLTDKQRYIMDQYYNYDLTLHEIAENEGISRQGVHDLIKRSEQTLFSAEEKLRFQSRLDDIRSELEQIYESLDSLSNDSATGENIGTNDNPTGIDIKNTGTIFSVVSKCKERLSRIINNY